jgi:hypothetical protein
MAMSSQELSELKSRVLVAMRTGTNIARVSDYIISLIREAGSSLPERAKSDTDTEYLYSIIVAIENKKSGQAAPKTTLKEDPPVVEAAPEITMEELLEADPEPDTDNQWVESSEESEPEHVENAPKNKGGKQSKKGKK